MEYGTKDFNFYARIVPETVNPEALEYKIKHVYGNHTCIVNPKKSNTQDKSGWIKYQFDTNSSNSIGKHDIADFVFTVKDHPEITQFLRIDSN